ncbi:BatD family protein [Ruegeria arenilitoris]|uniref:BatD family protein n=1 Tax=Ruegeria arenilitoris TaxID=1173585 RepID=UPI00147BA3C7|nr:BatD family protein [Ruegeria arenilitoris]
MRYLALLMLLIPVQLFAQTSVQPQVTAETPTDPVIVGQPAIVRIKVLVPTFMPSPPVFPSLEQENLLVRLPERASGPVSETIEGETWSGVQRSYRLYPLSAGEVAFGAQDVVVTFADPDTNAPVQVSLPLPELTLNAVVPEGARDLDPLIIATGLTVDQQIDGDTNMENGGSITRRLTAKISGTTPFLVPELIPDNPDPLLRAYPKEPRFTENEDRGVLSGQRVDEVVYLAQDGGQTQLPPISIRWYNLDSDQVETIDIAPVDLTLARPKWQPPDAETIIRFVVWLVACALFIWLAIRFLRPRVDRWRQLRRDQLLASPDYALGELKKALQDHDIAAAYAALEIWKSRSGVVGQTTSLDQHLAQIGAARYSAHPDIKTEDWAAALSALASLRQSAQTPANPLPPLNP